VIQLDNTTKGKKMEYTPEDLALNERVCKLPVVVDIKEELEAIDSKVEEGFAKGKERMDKQDSNMKDLRDEVKELKSALIHGLKDVIAEVKDQKLSEALGHIKDRDVSDKTLRNGLILLLAASTLAVLGYLFIKAYG
jgi:hypothetical protein